MQADDVRLDEGLINRESNVATKSFLNNGGDLKSVCDDLTSKSSIQNLIVSVASAGITDAISDKLTSVRYKRIDILN